MSQKLPNRPPPHIPQPRPVRSDLDPIVKEGSAWVGWFLVRMFLFGMLLAGAQRETGTATIGAFLFLFILAEGRSLYLLCKLAEEREKKDEQ